MKAAQNAVTTDQPPRGLSSTWKMVISLAVSLHVLAVFVGPWAMPPQGSELARTVATGMGPYLQALRLDNGYRFFAPEPGPGHLVRYEVTTKDGKTIEGEFPNKQTQRPRLLYHRYFMLSEFLNSLYGPEIDERTAEKNPLANAQKELATAYAESYARHLIDKYNAKEVKLYMRQHRLPTMEDIRGGKKLSDPEFYDEHVVAEWEED
jgi:hypothetical protein